jgi:hypothetical protein
LYIFGHSLINANLNNRGEPIDVNAPIIHKFSRKLTPGDPRRAFPTSVVVSHIDRQHLPFQLNADAETLCEIKSDLSGADEKRFKKKNRHWWQFKEPYYRVDYQIRVVIGPADVRFELCKFTSSLSLTILYQSHLLRSAIGFDGQKLSKDNPITVEWQNSAKPEAVTSPVDDGVYEMVPPKGFAAASVLSLNRVIS